jgi:hypothetical protein
MCIFHKWTNWSEPYETTERRSFGNFGEHRDVKVVVQDKTCIKCRKTEVRKIREGGLNGDQ